jgi:hypothetical protein
MVDAVKAFRAATGAKCMARPQRFIAKWAGAMERSGRLDDAARSGRPQKLNDDQALDAAESSCGGFQQMGSSTTLHYLSVQEGISRSKKLQQIQRETGASNRTMLDSMKRVLPTLCMRTQRFSQSLSDGQKKERLRVSKLLVKKSRSYFKKVIWTDAAKFYIDTGPCKRVWVDRGRHNLLDLVDDRAPGKRQKQVCLAYYAAVSEDLGPLHIQLTSGTKGYNGRHLKSFKVTYKTQATHEGMGMRSQVWHELTFENASIYRALHHIWTKDNMLRTHKDY